MGIFSFLFGGNLKAQSDNNTDADNRELYDLTKEQIQFINKNAETGHQFLMKYSAFNEQKKFEFKYLDEALVNWKKSNEFAKEKPEKVIGFLGAVFGNKIVEELNFEWKIITDQYGTDYCVINENGQKNMLIAFPFSSAEKSVYENRPDSFVKIYQYLVKELNKN